MKTRLRLTSSLLLLCLMLFGAWQYRSVGAEPQSLATGQPAAQGKGAPASDSGESPKSKQLPLVAVTSVQTTALEKTLELTGTVTPTRTARMASPGEGPVLACPTRDCLVREGDLVKKGQMLLQIGRNKTAEAQLAATRQTLHESEAELRRIEQLVEAGAIPGAEVDGARSAYENARAQLAKALESSEDYTIAAPWNGIVSRVYVAEGDYVAPRAPLLEIFDPNSLVVQFAVPEAQSTEVRNGLAVSVNLDAHPGKTIPGKITRVYPQLDDKLRTRTVEATLSDPVVLLPGMFARIQVVLSRFAEAVTVPREAVLVGAQGESMTFVLRDGAVQKRTVKTGIEKEGRVQILSGVEPGEQVVVAGNENLKDGTKVRIRGDKNP